MKIGIDISQIVYKGSGVSRFTEGLVHAILENNKTNEWTFFFSSFRQSLSEALIKRIYNKGHKLIMWNVPPTALSLLWNNLHTSAFTPKIAHLDWFITSDWTEPKLPIKKATIVHDLVFHKYPETVHPKILKTQKRRIQLVTKESSLIFTDSESTASDLKELYSVPNSKICVNYPGISVNDEINNNSISETLTKYNLNGHFMLTVGKIEPRKNIKRLIAAYMKLLEQNPQIPTLAIAGMQGWGNELKVKTNKIVLLGYVTDSELTDLYQSALAFIYPSLYEGFGYPVVEAMMQGCPVATSNTSSLAEIAANGSALLFDPENEKDIADKMLKLMSDEGLRNDLMKKGRNQASQFTWKSYYNTLITTLKKKL